jgi:N-acetylglucosamine-6-phosphate deacetylase
VALPDGRLEPADVLIESGKIAEVQAGIEPPGGADVFELDGLILAPGFIDVHVHGGGGFSLMDGDAAAVEAYAKWCVSRGVTSFLATVCAAGVEEGLTAARAIAAASSSGYGANILGVNFEGPFVNSERRGALPRGWLQRPDANLLDQLLDAGPVRLMTLAPELDGAREIIALTLERDVRVAIGHTDATYAVAKGAFAAGASHVTHAFNAMRPLHHREPGPIGSAIEAEGVTIEVIADGVHLHPATAGMLIRAAGVDRVCLVTDAVSPAGLESGTFRIGREEAKLESGTIRLTDGTIAGSAATMDGVVRNVVKWGLASIPEALCMASRVPARAARVGLRKGVIEPGHDADLVALSEDLQVDRTWVGGRLVYSTAI